MLALCSRADREAPGDHVVEYGGTKVVLVEEELLAALADATIDAQQAGQGDDLIISRPGRAGLPTSGRLTSSPNRIPVP